MGKQPKIVTDDAATARLESRHAQVQADIEKLSPEAQKRVRETQAEVDAEIAKMNSELDEQYQIEARWRAATGLHHSDAEKVLKHMATQPVGKIIPMFGKQWVHTPFKTIVQAQQYVDVLQERVVGLMAGIQPEAVIHQLVEQRSKLLDTMTYQNKLCREAAEKLESLKKDSVTNFSAFGLMKLSLKRLFKRGNNG
jgi:hypothetical protein